jgi:Mrp family chromosome partitioning ATPase
MGRTLDTLRQADSQRALRAFGPAKPASDVPEECVTDWTLQEEVPFIEVGGPGKSVELSPSLVKHPPQVKVQPPHPPLAKGLAGPKIAEATLAVNLTETRPMAVVFEAWPGPAAHAGVAAEVIAHHHPEHPVSKEYATLFDKMVQGLQGAAPHVLMFSGLKPRVGTSTVLLNLAVIAARQSQRVAALDLNLARPGLASRLGHTAPAGMREVLAGSLAASQAMLPTAIAALHLLPAGGPGTANGVVSAEAIVWLMAWLRERYDAILIDGPCVEDLGDLAVLAPCVEGIYLVLPQGETELISKGVAQGIARMGGRLRGLIHTRFDA